MKRTSYLKIFLVGLLTLAGLWANAQDLDQISLKKGVKASGGLSFNNTFFNSNDSMVNRDPYVYTLCGDLNVNVAGIDLPFSFAITNTDKNYTQPFTHRWSIPNRLLIQGLNRLYPRCSTYRRTLQLWQDRE